MTANAIWFDAVTGSPSYTGNVLRLALGALVGGKSSTRPLGGHSGVARGTPTSTIYMSGTHPHVAVHQGFHDLETAGTAGGYLWYNDADVDLGALNAADATNPRISSAWVRVDDPSQDGTATPAVAFGITDGTPGATSSTRGAAGGPPNLPSSRCLELAQITVPNTGGGGTSSATVAWVAPYCSAAGGVVLCMNSTQYPASPAEGDEVYDLSLHYKLRYNGTAWVGDGVWTTYTPNISPGTGSFTSASATGKYSVIGKTMHWHADITITTNGTGASYVAIGLPVGFTSSSTVSVSGRATAVSGKGLAGQLISSNFAIFNYDNTYPGSNGEVLRVDATIPLA